MVVPERTAEKADKASLRARKARDFIVDAPSEVELTPTEEWSRRVRRVGGLIQVAFAALWLVRGSLVIGGGVSAVLIAASGVAVIGVLSYGIVVTAGTAPRPGSREGSGSSGTSPSLP